MNLDRTKEDVIFFRIDKQMKKEWKKKCVTMNISLTSLIINSVENRVMNDERRKVITFIEKQDNIFIKIEANINQIAKIANAQKFISTQDLKDFSDKLSEIALLKKQQNEVFLKIFSMLACENNTCR